MEKTQEVFFMVKHIILWQLKDELSAAEKAEIKANIKTGQPSGKWISYRRVCFVRSRVLWRCM
mgnify:CR=1 FL=1